MKVSKKLVFQLVMICCSLLIITGLLFPSVALYQYLSIGTNATKVAVYAIDTEGEDLEKNDSGDYEVKINCDDDVLTSEYKFKVKNTLNDETSDITQKYDVVVEFKKPLDDFVEVTLKDNDLNNGEIKADISQNGLKYTFKNNDWIFQKLVASEKDFSLIFTVNDATKVKEDLVISNIRVSVNTIQID